MHAPPESLCAALAGRYQVEREVGQGGMATVYLARDLKHHRDVAIKVVRPELAAALGAERFLREIDTAASLTHPHILPLHDSGESAGFLYFVMPYVDGESLRARLDRERQLPVDDALQIAREVADALACAHGHGIVHRDIKPANILIESGHAVVADFGIARAVSAAGGNTLTETGTTLGTPAYMSPEQAAGSASLDGRSDVYSLGCVLYEMLAGEPPFTGPTAESLVRQHLAASPRPVTALRPATPAWVAVALERALAKAPADRFTAAAFASALNRHDTGPEQAVAPPAPARAPGGTGTPTPEHTPVARRRSRAWAVAAVGILATAATGAALWLWRPDRAPDHPPAASHPRSAIAVLPFQNLSADAANAYFAGGLHDELLTQLSKVASLKVISRTSVMGYQSTSKPLKQIGDELGVGTVVEGSVQVIGGRLRVHAQLIDAATDQHLWADSYDRTLDDAFAIQSDLAQSIVLAVGAALSSHEKGRLTTAPTENAEAYRLYLQGREQYFRPGYLRQNLAGSERLLTKALALDPAFALAHATLAMVHGQTYWQRYDPLPGRAALQLQEAEISLRLAPGLPEAHAAMGMAYYWGQRDFRRALEELETARRAAPSDAALAANIGFAHRRLAQWDQVLSLREQALRLDPRRADLFWDLGGRTYELLHRYRDAVGEYDSALAIAPDLFSVAIRRGWAAVRWHGNLAPLRDALRATPADTNLGSQGAVTAQWAAYHLYSRDGESLLQELERKPTPVYEGQDFYLPAGLFQGWAFTLCANPAAARTAFESAIQRLDQDLKQLPGDWRLHVARGFALAGLRRDEEARREADWLKRSEVFRSDAYQGPKVAEDRTIILCQTGDIDQVLQELERLLSQPSWLTVNTLRLDPRWDPIRTHPRFVALLKKYGD